MALDKSFVNVILLGLAFMLIFAAFQTWGNIQTTIISSIQADNDNFEGANGYISMAIIYVVLAIFNWTSPSVISVIGPKFSMLIGGITYVLFIISFAVPRVWLLYSASVVLGIGAALIWTGQGNYLALNSTDQTISRNSGVFWAMLQMSMFIGNIFVYLVLQGKTEIDTKTRQIIVWTLSAIALGGLVVIFFFPKPPPRPIKEKPDTPTEDSNDSSIPEFMGPRQALTEAVKLFCTNNMLLLCFTFFYTGLELGFWSAVYGSCISFTENLPNRKELLGLSGIFFGVGEVLGGALFGLLGSKTNKLGRDPIVIAGFIVHTVTFFAIFVNFPSTAPFQKDTSDKAFISSNPYLAMTCSFLLGLGDACYNTQIYSILGGVYANQSASAFAIFKFTQSLAAAISLAYASKLVLYGQLSILLGFAIVGTITFVIVEWRQKRSALAVEHSISDSE
ncbi:hypothetical protein ABEB36_001116 [Hypothenemus hampei]|uniref:UNC93-like protein MFSD11 n=1 Tax=Hypothenemus hampei TaxID=57062 RepID=A0ABD1FDI4_HYPHA